MASELPITKVVEFNPSRQIKRGTVAPFVDMAALPENQRDISYTAEREFTGGGSRFQNGDTLFARITPCLENGKTAKVNALPDGVVAHGSTEFIVMAAKAPEYDEDYVYYLARHPEFRAFAEARMEGTSGRQRVSWQALSDFSFALPSPDQRKTIGSILRKLDDKIDLNRRINKTLEVMAQAIFKSWFVDFDPVKAKISAIAEGRDPLRAAMSAISGKLNAELDTLPPEQYEQLAATAALFPDEMEKSELGEIPRGWNPTPIRDVASVVKGKSYSSKDLVDNDQVALVTLKSFERGGGFRMDGFKPYVGPYKSEQVVLPGDLIVAYTDVTQAAELIGKPAVVVGVDDFKTLVASLDVGIVRPVNQRVSRQFLYGLFMTDAFQSHTFAHTSGTTVLHLAKEGVPSYIFACPDETLVGIYSEAAETMATKKQKLLDQNRSLATLRDTLLPKLLSGELLVTEVSAEAEA
jgi:type I restriction enzyme S subunit